MISVWHNERFLEYILLGAEALKSTTIHLTARVTTNDLNIAYLLTNHIDTSWTNNTLVTPINAKGGALRSTSVGDVLEHETKYYVVEPCGFRELSREEQTNLTYHTI